MAPFISGSQLLWDFALNTIVPLAFIALFYRLARKHHDKHFYWYIPLIVLTAAVWWWKFAAHVILRFPASEQAVSDGITLSVNVCLFTSYVALGIKLYFDAQKPMETKDLSDDRLLKEYMDAAQDWVFFYKSERPSEAATRALAYRKIVAIDGELRRRALWDKTLTPLLHDDRDSVRIVAAASLALASRGDERYIKILKDVAERPEDDPSNAIVVARYLITYITQATVNNQSMTTPPITVG